MLDFLRLQGLWFLLKSATTIELKQGLELNLLKLLRMLQLVLSHTHSQAAASSAPGALSCGPSAHPLRFVALQAEPPGRMALHVGHRQGLARGVAPGRLQQQVWGRSPRRHPRTCCRQGCAGHRLGELQILGLLHHHLQLLAGAQQFGGGGTVAFGGQGDPVEIAAERIHAAGFQVEGDGQETSRGLCLPCRKPTVCPVSALDLIAADLPQRGAEAAEIVMERLPAGDHHEGGPGRGGGGGFAGQLRQAAVRVAALRPGVLGVAPAAADAAAR